MRRSKKETNSDKDQSIQIDLPSRFLYKCTKCGFEEKLDVPISSHNPGGLYGHMTKEIQYIPDGVTCFRCGDHKTVMLVPCVKCLKDYTVNVFDSVSRPETKRVLPCPSCLDESKAQMETTGRRSILSRGKSRKSSPTGDTTNFQYYCKSCKKEGLHPVSHVLRPMAITPKSTTTGKLILYMLNGAPPFQITCDHCHGTIRGVLEKCMKCNNDWIFANFDRDSFGRNKLEPRKCPSCGGKWKRRNF